MKKMIYIKCAMATVVAGIIGLLAHVFLPNLIDPIISNLSQGVNIIKPEDYTAPIIATAYLTAIFPIGAQVLIYYFISDHLWFKQKILKGIVFAVIMLIMTDELIRIPIMNFLIGCPLKLVLMQQVQPLIINLLMGITIALIVGSSPYNRQL